jgi:transcriptional regulator with XRE-family HTH domain
MSAATPAYNCDAAALERRLAFGRAVRAARKAAGLQQWRLALLAGCDRQSITRIENGAHAPTLDRLWPLADALGVSLSDLCATAEASLSRAVKAAS